MTSAIFDPVVCQEKKRGLRARSGERALHRSESSAAHVCLTADGPCFPAGPDIHLLPLARKPSQMIECVFSASLETIRREPPESELLRSVAYQRDLAACASIDPDVFVFSFVRKGFLRGCGRNAFSGRHEILLPAFNRHHVADHLPGHRQCRPVGISSLQLAGTDHGQFR